MKTIYSGDKFKGDKNSAKIALQSGANLVPIIGR